MNRRIPATTAQHRAAALRLLAMRSELHQVLDELGVGASSPGGPYAHRRCAASQRTTPSWSLRGATSLATATISGTAFSTATA